MSVSSQSPPESEDARTFLRDLLGREVSGVEWVGEGAWSRCFGYTDRGRHCVVRFGRFLDDFEQDRRAASFGSEVLPIPEVAEIGEAFGGYFAISSRAYGEPLESLDPEGWEEVLPSLFAALDATRSVDLATAPGYGGWGPDGRGAQASWREFLLTVDVDTPDLRTHGWRKKLRSSPGGDDLFRAGYALLRELATDASVPRCLVHSDLINRNVLVANGCISAVFDWGCSLYGDFLYDLAWLEFWSPWYPALQTLDIRTRAKRHYAAIGLEVPDFDARMRCCMLHIGLSHLAYNAHTGSHEDLADVAARTEPMVRDERP